MKKLRFLLALGLLAAGTFTASCNADVAIGCVEVEKDNSISMKYSMLSGTRTYQITSNGDTDVAVRYTTTSGSLKVTIGKPGEAPVYEGNVTEDLEFKLSLKDAGDYTVRITADKHQGSYFFQW